MKKLLQNWLMQLENKTIKDDKYCLLLLGENGSGRTTLITNFFKENDYYLHVINMSNCYQKKYLSEMMNKIIIHRHNFFFDKNKKHALLIDELDGISITEKGRIGEIIEIIRKVNQRGRGGYDITPIICVGNTSYLKKKNELEKICRVLQMEPPNHKILSSIIHKWAKDNDIKLSQKVLLKLVESANKNIHSLNNILIYIITRY